MTGPSARRLVAAAAAATVVALMGTYVVAAGSRPPGASYSVPTASGEDLQVVQELRIFFAHQSVGRNILEGVSDLYLAHGLPAPETVEVADAGPSDRLVHVLVGENGDPLGKIEQFEDLVRGGLGRRSDVAVLKFCYSDIRADTDVDHVFAAYRETLTALQGDYPEVRFVAATVPLTIRRSAAGTIKEWVGRGDRYGPEHNVARERFNSLIRQEYRGPGELFDIAAVESTGPDGTRETGRHKGDLYYALDRTYALDPGHLNTTGSRTVAESLVTALARGGH